MKNKIYLIISIIMFVLGTILEDTIFSDVFILLGLVLLILFFIKIKKFKKIPQTNSKSEISPISKQIQNANNDQYEFISIKVAGVTFKNGRKSRQSILRKIKFKDEPFNNNVDIDFRIYQFEESDAIGIYANNEQIGNVPHSMVEYLINNWSRIDIPTDINIYGGGRGNDGENKNFGCEITLMLHKSLSPIK